MVDRLRSSNTTQIQRCYNVVCPLGRWFVQISAFQQDASIYVHTRHQTSAWYGDKATHQMSGFRKVEIVGHQLTARCMKAICRRMHNFASDIVCPIRDRYD